MNGRLGLLAVLALGLFPVAALNSASLNSIGDAIAKVDHAEQLKGNPKLQAPTVTLPSNSRGSLKGKWTSPLVRTFLGIPFAAPPTRDLRWRPPQPAAKWTGVKDASSNPPNCLQPLWPAKNISALTPGADGPPTRVTVGLIASSMDDRIASICEHAEWQAQRS